MTLTRAFGRSLAAAAAAALFLAQPQSAGAVCKWIVGDLDKNGTTDLKLVGQAGSAEKLTIDASPTSTVVSGCINKTFTQEFGRYVVAMGGGNVDVVNFNVTGAWVGLRRPLEVQLGGGVSKVTVGGTGSMTAGSSLVVEIHGMGGADTIALVPPSMDDSIITTRTDLNGANDGVIVKLDNPVTGGSLVKFDASLGGGLSGDTNNFKFSQSGLLDATVDVRIEGGYGADNGSLLLAGPIGPNARLYYRSNLGGGNDNFDGQVDLAAASIAAGGEVHVQVFGNAGTDALTFGRKGTTATPATTNAGLLDVYLNGGTENDVLGSDLAGGGFVLDGTLRLRLEGGGANDTLNALIDVQAASLTPNLDVLLYGAQGTDKLTATVHDDGPHAPGNYGPAGNVILDGGVDAGDDCGAVGNGLTHERNCES